MNRTCSPKVGAAPSLPRYQGVRDSPRASASRGSRSAPGGFRRRGGQLTVMFIAGLSTFLLCLAMVVDVGYFYTVKAQIQAQADIGLLSSLSAVDPTLTFEEQDAQLRQRLEAFEKVNFDRTGLFSLFTEQDVETGGLGRARLEFVATIPTYFARLANIYEQRIGVAAAADVAIITSGGQPVYRARLVY